MAKNNFKPFAIGSDANVVSQADYEAAVALLTGFQSGKASSAQINKAIRQSSVMAYVLAQFISDSASVDVLDNGTPATILDNLLDALKNNISNNIGAAGKLGVATNAQMAEGTSTTLLPPVAVTAKAISDAIAALSLGNASRANIASSTAMAAGTATDLLPSVAAVMSIFSKRAFGASDYIRIPDVPGGLIIQWGRAALANSSSMAVSYGLAFPTACRTVMLTNIGSNTPQAFGCVGTVTSTYFNMYGAKAAGTAADNGTNWLWLAIGY